MEFGSANKGKFLAYIALAHVCKSAKENKVVFNGKTINFDEYRDKILGKVDEKKNEKDYQKAVRSKAETFRNRKHAGIAYEQFFLKGKDDFKICDIPQLTSIATILGMKASAVQIKKIGKWNQVPFRPKHIPEVWRAIKEDYPCAALNVNTFRKALAAKIHCHVGESTEEPTDESTQTGESNKKDQKKLTLKEKFIHLKREVMALKKYLEKHENQQDKEIFQKKIWRMFVELEDEFIDDNTALFVPGKYLFDISLLITMTNLSVPRSTNRLHSWRHS